VPAEVSAGAKLEGRGAIQATISPWFLTAGM
jgi:hypothetical protein